MLTKMIVLIEVDVMIKLFLQYIIFDLMLFSLINDISILTLIMSSTENVSTPFSRITEIFYDNASSYKYFPIKTAKLQTDQFTVCFITECLI